MSQVKLACIYYSSTGTNYQMVKWAQEAALEEGAEVRVVKVKELAPEEAIRSNPAWQDHMKKTADIKEATSEDIVWADAIIFSTPTRFGVMSSQMKQFIDEQGGLWAKGQTMNKVVSVMTSAQNENGGQEATILSFYTVMMHWGAIIAAPGYTDPAIAQAGGNPYGVSVTVNQHGEMQKNVEAAVKHQARRVIHVAKKMKD
ncbi:NAD(P)H dehydrogenase (quinone) [Cerasibacillus quisquiliarum]|uniref:NAD(P)H dehydrogenase (Quinone) n=1 Tax=Cerasibacillus quisquiliarum TaxID=227865 RepID=A0A511UW78_9BACI|nr:NAD(P)H:quinone oxidoreductase [Cerasibacillus quisquiliarum]MBB5146100.1 NAD(P)H dehydrogenase (quinone) [Cerasibacillus quisquiliarum]GEN30834.1 NAD(P)H dehydrogenase (quinone) [Cerasibacillus quisquiliarum]